MSRKRVFVLAAVSIVALFAIAACSETQVPTQVPVEFHPTSGPAIERDDSQVAPPVEEVKEVAEPEASGDAAAGEGLFTGNGCSGCHAIDDSQLVGPGLGTVYARAADRTSLDADAYIAQSITEPGAFLVDGFAPLMPTFAQFSDEEITNLTAYLRSLGGEEEAAAPAAEAASGDPALGEALFTGNGCAGCHATDGTQIVGPGLGGLADRAGSRTDLDANAYIEQSIKESGAFVVDGFAPIMPAFATMSDEDLQNLVAYLNTLN